MMRTAMTLMLDQRLRGNPDFRAEMRAAWVAGKTTGRPALDALFAQMRSPSSGRLHPELERLRVLLEDGP